MEYSKWNKWLLIVLSFLIVSCSNEARVNEEPQEIQLPFKSIIIKGWEGNLLDLQKVFPGGKLRRGDLKKRIAASYFLKVEMSDVNLSGNLNIHQREIHINQTKPTSLPVRVLYIPCENNEELKNYYKTIKQFLKKEFSAGDNSDTIKEREGYFIKLTPDLSKGVNLEIVINEKNNRKNIEIILQELKFAETNK